MLVFTNSKEKQSPTIIGAGCTITGNIRAAHIVQVHGTVLGDINAETVVVGRGGLVRGKITCNVLFLHGTVDGPTTADTAHIYSDGKMTGQLSYNMLHITGNNCLECTLKKRGKK